jgi:predicted nucleic acid-binding protein
MNIFFADTFYFVALLNQKDQYHGKATRFRRGLTARLVTAELILIEVADRLARGKARLLVPSLFQDLRDANDCEVVAFSDVLFKEAMDLYGRHRDKDWTLTDCASFVVMRARQIDEALTGDHHFEQAGFIALLK